MTEVNKSIEQMLSADEIKRAWVRALRGGEYRQTTGRLRQYGAYCCLGVLCDLLNRDEWRGDSWKGWGERLPEETNDLIGLSVQQESLLVKMNDNGSTFSEIADWIEAHL